MRRQCTLPPQLPLAPLRASFALELAFPRTLLQSEIAVATGRKTTVGAITPKPRSGAQSDSLISDYIWHVPNNTNRRRVQTAPAALVLPTALLSPGGPGAYPYPASRPILVDGNHRVLLGTSRLLTGVALLPVIEAHLKAEASASLRALDAVAKPIPSVLAYAAAALRQAGIPLRWVQDILGCTDIGTASRWTRLATLPWPVLQALDRSQIRMGHARHFLGLAPAVIMELLARCHLERWSVNHLQAVIAGTDKAPSPSPGGADIEAFAGSLGDSLGAEIQIQWPDREQDRRLVITWYDVEGLKGVMGQLARGPPSSETYDSSSSYRRNLEIVVRSASELDALTGHLVQR